MNTKLQFYFDKPNKWQQEFIYLRKIILQCPFSEELKWGHPCYTIKNKNVVLIHGFKEYCAIMFFKGALMKDPHQQLIQQTKNVQATRQWRFTNIAAIKENEASILEYLKEAIAIEEAGLKVPMKKTSDFVVCEEFKNLLSGHKKLKAAFEKLTPGRQRAYLLYFSSAIFSSTRVLRIYICVPKILKGQALDIKYS